LEKQPKTKKKKQKATKQSKALLVAICIRREETMQLELPDKNANLETPDGRKFYQNGDHVVEVPEDVGRQFLQADIPGVREYKKLWGGVDFKELAERAKRWKEARQ
jgi:hypothetical protein